MTCETGQVYTEFLNGRIDVELKNHHDGRVRLRAGEILHSAVIIEATNLISPEDLEKIKGKIFEVCPQLAEDPKDEIPQEK